MKRKITIVLAVLVLLMNVFAAVSAVEIPNPEKLGSITFTMVWNEEKLDSGSLTMYRVGDIHENHGDYSFVLIPELADSRLSLEDLSDPELAQSLCVLAKERQLPGITAPIENGEAVFANLLPGLYVVTQTQEEASEGFAPILPFLISLPQMQYGDYVYDLTAMPKVSLEPIPTEPSDPTDPTQPPPPDLPQTGQLNWPVPFLAVAGFALFVLGWYLRFGKKHAHEK